MSGTVSDSLAEVMRVVINNLIFAGYAIISKQPFTDAQLSAPRPTDAYCSIGIVSINAIGQEESRYITEVDSDPVNVEHHLGAYYEIMYSINFYRTDCIGHATAVRIGLMRQASLDYFRSVNFGLGIRSNIRDISEQTSKGWEQRVQMDVVLSTNFIDKEILAAIKTIIIPGVLEPSGQGTPITSEAKIE